MCHGMSCVVMFGHDMLHVYVMRRAGWLLRTRSRYLDRGSLGSTAGQGLEVCRLPTPNLNPPPPRPGSTGPSPTHIINVWWRGSCFPPSVDCLIPVSPPRLTPVCVLWSVLYVDRVGGFSRSLVAVSASCFAVSFRRVYHVCALSITGIYKLGLKHCHNCKCFFVCVGGGG